MFDGESWLNISERHFQQIVVCDGEIYGLFESDDVESSHGVYSHRVFVYSPALDIWIRAPSFPYPEGCPRCASDSSSGTGDSDEDDGSRTWDGPMGCRICDNGLADYCDSEDHDCPNTSIPSHSVVAACCGKIYVIGGSFGDWYGAVSYTHLTLPTKRIV